MKKTNRMLSLLLALVMIFSSLSLVASAKGDAEGLINVDPAKNIVQGYVTNTGNANERNASILLDWVDGLLKEENIFHEKIELRTLLFKVLIYTIEIDLTSIDGILKTIDLVKGIPEAGLELIGDLGDLNLKNWKTGQTREKTGNAAVLNSLITLLSDNKAVVTKVVDGSFQGGQIENLGLVSAVPAENYVQIAPSTQFSDSFTETDYEALVADMFAGKVTVSNDITVAAADCATVITVVDQGNIK